MTINVALATFDAVVLGCDSLSSVVSRAIVLHRVKEFAKAPDGALLRDAFGNLVVPVSPETTTSVATTVFGGVSKMFSVYADDEDECVVAAVTAGQAILNGLTIATQAQRFRKHTKATGEKFDSVGAVADAFLKFMRTEWEKDCDYENLPESEREYLSSVQFLLGGYGSGAEHGQIYRLDVHGNTSVEQFADYNHTGVCWSGMADHAERLIRGYDQTVRVSVGRQIKAALEAQRSSLLNSIQKGLEAAGIDLPEGFTLPVEETFDPTFDWDANTADIDFANLPLQYAVEFVSLIVNTQSGMMRLGRAIPTVGGRTHIGVLRRGEPFKMLNEAELEHKHVGYAHET